VTRDELRDRIIDRAAEAECALARGGLTPFEEAKARAAIERALKAIDYSDAGARPAVRESAGIAVSDRLK
jgi:hypothetical protein